MFENVYLIGTSPYSYRLDEPAEIIGIYMLHVKDMPRLCYMVKYIDGVHDFVPVEDSKNYSIVTKGEIKK